MTAQRPLSPFTVAQDPRRLWTVDSQPTTIAANRADAIRWSFIFWTGQLIALAALFAALR